MAINHGRSADIAHIAAAARFDALYVDMEHYPFSIETASMLCTAAIGTGVTPLVRVPDPRLIGRILDGGAAGVIVPHVENAEEARQVVKAARFPPIGDRGFPGPNPVSRFRSYGGDDMIARMDSEVTVIVMLESPQAIEAADEIAAVEGVDVLLIGSNDLAMAMGITGDLRNPRIFQAYQDVAAACSRHGKTLGVGGVRADPELAQKLIQLGARFFITGSDTGYLMAAATDDTANFRAIPLVAHTAAAK